MSSDAPKQATAEAKTKDPLRGSRFDWGETASWGSLRSMTSLDTDDQWKKDNSNASRYDPEAMTRITDVVIEDSDDDSIEHSNRSNSRSIMQMAGDLEKGGAKYDGPAGMPNALRIRQVFAITALIALILAASLAIGFAVIDSGDRININHSTLGMIPAEQQQPQQLLEIAERVVTECDEVRLNEDMSQCRKLCLSKLCCFEDGESSCEEDESKNCAVYAGCEALVEVVPMDVAEVEDEE